MYEFTKNPQKYIETVDEVFTELSGKNEYSNRNGEAKELNRKALMNGLEFVLIDQKHIGSDGLYGVMEKFKKKLEDKGVEFSFLDEVDNIYVEDNEVKGIIGKEVIESEYVIIAPGREGTKWFEKIANENDIALTYLPIDIGVRIETLDTITKPITDIQYDPKIRMNYQDMMVRNFCTNPKGFVVTENYDKFYLVNGHAEKERQSENCNFAVLFRVPLTNPISNTTSYARNIARTFNLLGDNRPIVQRLKNLQMGRRSKERRLNESYVRPTLENAVPGDLSLAMPSKILDGILEYLKRLDNIIPGINVGDNTLLYAPEIKFQAMKGEVNQSTLESSVENLFLAGDGCGLTGGIVQAAVTGIIAAEGIIEKNENSNL